MREENNYSVGVLIYPQLEMLEATGPAEVFSAANGFNIGCIGLSEEAVQSRSGLRLLPDYTLSSCPHVDVLVIPGGGAKIMSEHRELLRWLQAMTIRTSLLMSVCSGAYLLAAAGLLDGRSYTSSAAALKELPELVKGGRAIEQVRYLSSDNIITTAGPSSGIDGALHIIKMLQGSAAAQQVAQRLAYPLWPENTGLDRPGIHRKSENSSAMGNK